MNEDVVESSIPMVARRFLRSGAKDSPQTYVIKKAGQKERSADSDIDDRQIIAGNGRVAKRYSKQDHKGDNGVAFPCLKRKKAGSLRKQAEPFDVLRCNF